MELNGRWLAIQACAGTLASTSANWFRNVPANALVSPLGSSAFAPSTTTPKSPSRATPRKHQGMGRGDAAHLSVRRLPGSDGELWSGSMSSDRVLRFDPQTGKSVEYLLPRQTNIRRVFVDDTGDVLGRQ